MEQTPTTRPSLLARLRDPRDERAWREFAAIYAPLVYRLPPPNSPRAAEQVQEEFSELAWRAFWQTGVEGRPAAEVAQALGTTIGTVYHCKSRVMARLRQKIEEVAEDMGTD